MVISRGFENAIKLMAATDTSLAGFGEKVLQSGQFFEWTKHEI